MSLATLKKTRGIICGTHGPTGTLLHHEEGKAMDGNHIDERSDGAGGSSPTREERVMRNTYRSAAAIGERPLAIRRPR